MYPREGDNRPQRQPDAMDPYYPPDPVLSAAHVVHLERCFGLMAQTGLLPQHIERDVFRNALYGVHRAMVEEGQEIGPFLIESTCTAIVSNITAQSNFIHPERCRDMELKLRMTYNSTVRGEDQYMNFRYEICRPDQSRNIVPGDRGLRVVP